MKIFFVCLGLLALLGAGCTTSTTSKMPDEFYARGSWRFDGDESVINFGVKGVAIIDMHFTRQTADQYLIDGTVTYKDETLGCDIFPRFTLCPKNTCEVVGTTVGELTGVAAVRGSQLEMSTHWLTKPDESATFFCSDTITSTNSGWAVWQTMGPLGAKIVDEPWGVDISGSFIDDLPIGEVTDTPVISANFNVEANDVTAEGLIGFYRNKPE
ncbi:MAG: hypothetical protein AAB337_01750 [Patescibacteria group bacterium]